MRILKLLLLLLVMMTLSGVSLAADSPKRTEFPENDIQGRYSVEIKGFSADLPAPGDRFGPLQFDLILELDYLPEEHLPFAVRPTAQEFEIFKDAVMVLEPKIRKFVEHFLTEQKEHTLMDGGEQTILRDKTIIFVNDELERYDFTDQDIRRTLSRRRITDVFFPNWMIM